MANLQPGNIPTVRPASTAALDFLPACAHAAPMTTPKTPVEVAEHRAASGEISRQRLAQIRRREGIPAGSIPTGSPETSAADLTGDGKGGVEVKIKLRRKEVEAAEKLAERMGLRGRNVLLARWVRVGLTAALRRAERAAKNRQGGANGP